MTERDPMFSEYVDRPGIIWGSPEKLVEDNPATGVINEEQYRRLLAHFSEGLFDAPQVARVAVSLGEHGEAIKLFVVDGHTRSKAAANKGIPMIPLRDATKDLINNPLIVPDSERATGQEVLTLAQWLRAVVPPTIEHAKIAPDRVAAYLINAWENLVGPDLSPRFSTLAAMSVVATQREWFKTVKDFQGLLVSERVRRQRFIVDETLEQREEIERSLVQMVEVIVESKLSVREVVSSAFKLLTKNPDVVGGDEQVHKEIMGLMYAEGLDRKLAGAFRAVGGREAARNNIGTGIIEALDRAVTPEAAQSTLASFAYAISNPEISFDELVQMVEADYPAGHYSKLQREKSISKARDYFLGRRKNYMVDQSDRPLTLEEEKIIRNLGQSDAVPYNLDGLVRETAKASEILLKAAEWRDKLEQEREELLAAGVRKQTVDRCLGYLGVAREKILVSFSVSTLVKEIKGLVNQVANVERIINREIGLKQARGVINEVFGDKLKKGYGLKIEYDIADYIVKEYPVIDDSNRRQVQARIRALATLDEKALSEVLSGYVKFDTAIARKLKITQVNPVMGYSREEQAEVEVLEEVILGEVVEDPELKEKRIAYSNEVLERAISSFMAELGQLDLARDELRDEVKEQIDEMLLTIGRLRFDQRDIVRILESDYPRLLQGRIRDVENQVYQENEDAQKDARTGR